ncbi:PAS domain S-box-containing protein [Desulfonispora thiosulfatigenes DSM 11270]|uniref:histidine kinase n=1 Tax=Desulfonispora thiosulfatigenes DSM 11270 TaxID=656914 RepID=A0A1W1VHU9_DESTI|nr:ATP-binding protein [Desulfonispora thiosulfatigenes]SMB92631.1 PAS domain S-box-containing protein [Desulfonispora thiosulfatigenes DSM 11270]
MTHDLERKRIINNYIMKAQIVFFAISTVILLKSQQLEYDGLILKSYLTIIFMISFLIGISLVSLSYQNSSITYNKIYTFLIIINLIIINITIMYTNIYEIRFLYLIPVIICATTFCVWVSIFLSIFIGIINITIIQSLTKILYPFNYTYETDIIFTGILILLAWLISTEFEVEKNLRMKLMETKVTLYKNKVLLETLINEISMGVFVIDGQGKFVHVNKQAIKILGIYTSYEDLISVHYKKFLMDINLKYPYTDSLVYKVLHEKQEKLHDTTIYNNKLLELVCQPVYEKNILKYAILTFSDITNEEKIREKVASFERLEAINQTVASVAHEIKNPLTTIKGFLDLSLKSNIDLDKSQLTLLTSEVDRCITIASDFLACTKKSNQAKKILNLEKIIRNHSLLLEKDALFNQVKLDLKLDEVSNLLIYENEIKQLLLNLTRNSIEAMEQGGKLIISLNEDKDHVYLKIKDNGKGIPEEVLEKLGTPFLTTKENGTGLGMTICYQIAERNNAKLTINSGQGLGTEITVSFLKEGLMHE